MLARRNVAALRISQTNKNLLGDGLTLPAAGTAWARIEAGKHFPSDVLAGAALGNFIPLLIYDTFMGLDEDRDLSFLIEPSRERFRLKMDLEF